MFGHLSDTLLQRGQLILDTGYSWMVESILLMVERQQLRVAEGLYALSRELFPERTLQREVWFATVGPAFGFRLISPDVTRAALDAITLTTLDLPVNPIDFLAELLATRLPRDQLMMNVAAKGDQTIDVDLRNAGYARTDSRYSFVLNRLYGSYAVTMMPLLRSHNFAVLALFPTGRAAIRDRLEVHRDEFGDRALELSGTIVDAATLFDPEPSKDREKISSAENVAHLLGMSIDDMLSGTARKTRRWAFRLGRRNP